MELYNCRGCGGGGVTQNSSTVECVLGELIHNQRFFPSIDGIPLSEEQQRSILRREKCTELYLHIFCGSFSVGGR